MDAAVQVDKTVQTLVDAALAGRLSEPQAKQLAGCAPEVVAFVLLAAAKRIAELTGQLAGVPTPDLSTPSGQVPIYTQAQQNPQARSPRRQARP